MNNQLSQEEINALLEGTNQDDSNSEDAVDNINAEGAIDKINSEEEKNNSRNKEGKRFLSEEERDAIGEISNISMGSASTALSTLLNSRVNITTPKVSYSTWDELSSGYDKPCVLIQIYYKEGLDGSNILIIKEEDVKYITDIMMGGDGSNLAEELTELHLSAISEAMNQMMGSAATSLSTLLNTMVDITPPSALRIDLNDELEDVAVEAFLEGEFVKVSFNMVIGDQVDTNIIQLYPFEFAHNVYNKFMAAYGMSNDHVLEDGGQQTEDGKEQNNQLEESSSQDQELTSKDQEARPKGQGESLTPRHDFPEEDQDVGGQPALFQSLTNSNVSSSQLENMDIIMDVTLEVRVELGRTKKSIKEILDFTPGTIIELDKLSGDPVDVLVNGKIVAKGEVVVIDESFGVRITEVLNN